MSGMGPDGVFVVGDDEREVMIRHPGPGFLCRTPKAARNG